MSIYKTRIEIARRGHLAGGSWVIEKLNQVTVLFGRNALARVSYCELFVPKTRKATTTRRPNAPAKSRMT